ncbi:MAG TPA: S41 family peptidase [Candidatus Limnocylindrales bacterium]
MTEPFAQPSHDEASRTGNPPADAPVPPADEAVPAPAFAAAAAPPPPPASGPAQSAPDASAPPPPPKLRAAKSSGVPKVLVAVLAPVLAIVMFAGGLAVGQSSGAGIAAAPNAPAAAGAAGSPSPSGSTTPDQGLALVEQAWHDIQDNYVDAQHLDNQQLAYQAIQGIVQAVGDSGHTSFMTAAEAKAMDQSLSGTFVGIGVQVAPDDGKGGVVVGQVFPNTPAQQAGLQRGDRIVGVNGKPTTGQTQDQIVTSIRGPEGSDVTLTIERAGKPNFDVKITRRKYDLPLSSWSMVPGSNVAYIRLDSFATGAGKAVTDAIQSAKSAGATSIVFDLRDNGGGYVNEAIAVASQFVGDGTVYQSIDRSGNVKDIPVTAGGLATTMPVVVLANGNTASAAEIVTGAIQDAGRGQVVGEKTFGTGTVLGRFELADGSVLRIGTERWQTRNGRPIWHEGLDPNVTVALGQNVVPLTPDDVHGMTAAQLAGSSDAQLLKAIDLAKAQG